MSTPNATNDQQYRYTASCPYCGHSVTVTGKSPESAKQAGVRLLNGHFAESHRDKIN